MKTVSGGICAPMGFKAAGVRCGIKSSHGGADGNQPVVPVIKDYMEGKKDLAKRFFTLLYLFLTRNYEHVELVFIRHTDNAEEVDEETFFHDPKSGGTVVLSALELMHDIIVERFPSSEWNIYAAQATDGDAFGADAGKSARYLSENLLPLTRYFAYIEVLDEDEVRRSSLWVEYERESAPHFAMRRVRERSEIFPVFRDLFKKELA